MNDEEAKQVRETVLENLDWLEVACAGDLPIAVLVSALTTFSLLEGDTDKLKAIYDIVVEADDNGKGFDCANDKPI